MNQAEVRNVLVKAAKVRAPRFTKSEEEVGPRQKIEMLEDYILATAQWRSVLQEAELYSTEHLKDLRKRWEHLTGWEQHRRTGEKTKASVEDAKREADPNLWDEIQDYEWLVNATMRQVRRLENDYDAASRTYTTITGGA